MLFTKSVSYWVILLSIIVVDVKAAEEKKIVEEVPLGKARPTDASGHVTSGLIKQGHLCMAPATTLCDTRYNQKKLNQEKEALENFESLLVEARRSSAFQNYLKTQSIKHCSQSKSASGRQACWAKLKELEENLIFTAERKRQATQLFARVKADILKYLTNRGKHPVYSSFKDGAKYLKNAIDTIAKTELVFGSKYSDLPLGFDLTYSNDTQKMYLEGLAFIVDKNPESLYFRMVREFGYVLDPCEFANARYDAKYSAHPFKLELSCLEREDSIQASLADASCFSEMAKKGHAKLGHLQEDLYIANEAYKSGVDHCALQPFIGNWDDDYRLQETPIGCHVPQVTSAMADWLAVEIFSQNLPEAVWSRSIDAKKKPAAYTRALINSVQWKSLTSATSWMCESFSPSYSKSDRRKRRAENFEIDSRMEDRLNAVLFANPRVKASLGCGYQYIGMRKGRLVASQAWYMDEKESPDFRMDAEHFGLPLYCGVYLYGSTQ